jgi:hypothetical protein
MAGQEKPRRAIAPFVRHMLLCDDVRPVTGNQRKVTVYGLTSVLKVGQSGFPARFGFTVYLQLTAGRGAGNGRIVVVDAEDGSLCYEGQDHPMTFSDDPLLLYAAKIRIPSCELPRAGLYWVEFWYEGMFVAREPLLVR